MALRARSFAVHASVDGSTEQLGARNDLPAHRLPWPGGFYRMGRFGDGVSSRTLQLYSPPRFPPSAGSVIPSWLRAPRRGQGWQEAAGGRAALTLLPWHRVRTSWGDMISPGAHALGARCRLVDICFNKNHAGVCKPF